MTTERFEMPATETPAEEAFRLTVAARGERLPARKVSDRLKEMLCSELDTETRKFIVHCRQLTIRYSSRLVPGQRTGSHFLESLFAAICREFTSLNS